MRFGLTGNTNKDLMWPQVEEFIAWLSDSDRPYVLHPNVAERLAARGLGVEHLQASDSVDEFLNQSDLVLSFGGDGTLLNTVHEVGNREIPILGVNHGRLGFLAHIEAGDLNRAIERIERDEFIVDKRLVLEAVRGNHEMLPAPWALNEFTFQRTGETGLLTVEVSVDGVRLNTYWADGLIISTPTGSTAYSLAVSGPIMAPGCGGILITPIASHTLTVRPIVLPEDSHIDVRVLDPGKPHIFTADGIAQSFEQDSPTVRIQKAEHHVHLVTFPDQDYFSTLRNKLMWGVRKGVPDRESRTG